jgi:hypothetical protein
MWQQNVTWIKEEKKVRKVRKIAVERRKKSYNELNESI